MAVHFRERSYLSEIHVLSVTESDDLVEGENELERFFRHFRLIESRTIFRNLKNKFKKIFSIISLYHSRKESKRFQVFEYVRRFRRQKDHEHFFERLINVAHALRFDERVLFSRAYELGKGGEKAFDARSAHFDELARDER